MKIKFNIHFKTQWGQKIYLLLYPANQYDDNSIHELEMQYNSDAVWTAELNIDKPALLKYRYALKSQANIFEQEFGDIRVLKIDESNNCVNLIDGWRTSHGDSPFESAAFTNCFFKRKKTKAIHSRGDLVLNIYCPQMEPNCHLAIVGNQQVLGNWDTAAKVRMDESDFPMWSIALNSSQITFPLEYKYLIVDSITNNVLAWDKEPNRRLEKVSANELTIVNNEEFVRQIPSWRGAGVAIPVFSLRSENGFGIGEFDDLKKLVDWAKKTGQRMIQTLPINDTTLHHNNNDSYPYNAVSVYALHPIYLNLDKLGELKDTIQKEYFAHKKLYLNSISFADYQQVMSAKWEFFKQIFPQESSEVFASENYLRFFESNKNWLVPYAVFSYLRDVNNTPVFSNWKQYSVYNSTEISTLASPQSAHYEDIAIYYFLQFHLHQQLVEVHNYANNKGIAIKGDIPIGVSPFSVDAWVEPNLFNFNMQAGAPPDDFSETGQNWGFPTYNWELMELDGYKWWKNRFQKLAEYFDAYRIDHILGFFRIWGIPDDAVWGLTGSFQPALPYSSDELQLLGLNWDENRYLKPYINDKVLLSLFGSNCNHVKAKYLLPESAGNFKFKPEFDTQKKIKSHFESLSLNDEFNHQNILNGLLMLHCEVVFVPDIQNSNMYHPRISMHSSATYANLSETTRYLLNNIYVDYFYHRHTEFWREQALKKLPAIISATNMLVCGEDLGMVPNSVPDVMNFLEILSLEIQRMPKRPNTEFAMPADAPYMAVCTTSTHDMNPLRAWWEEDFSITQRFYNNALKMQGVAPVKCEPWIAQQIIEQHLNANSMLIVLPLQDWLALDAKLCTQNPLEERINVPSNPHNFWCYRMHITLEQLLKETNFNNKLKQIINQSGR